MNPMQENHEPDPSLQRYVYLVPSQSALHEAAGEIGLDEIWRMIWIRRRLVFGVTLISAIAAAAYSLVATQWYQADVVLLPVKEKSISGGLSQLSSLGSLVGINIPLATGSEPVAVLKSKSFARQFIEDEKLLPILLADKWNAGTGEWKTKGPEQPDVRDGVKYFDEKVRTVVEDKKTGLVTLSIQWKNRADAANWANLLASRLNDRLRTEAIEEAQVSIDYLQKEMTNTSNVSLGQSISKVLESEMQKMALARANKEFAFKVVDSAFPPKRRKYPQRTLIVAMAAVLGALAGMMYVVLSARFKGAKVERGAKSEK
jgi:uncharacterized protein involved in exopolysaccharide biosynthesis